MPRAIVEFPDNQPVFLSLKFLEGRVIKNGQVMYTVIHDGQEKVMFLNSYVASKIAALKPQGAQMLKVVKQPRTDGKKGYTWEVDRMGEQLDGTFTVPKAGPDSLPESTGPASGAPSLQVQSRSRSDIAPETITERKPVSSSMVASHCQRLIDITAECVTYAQKHGAAVSREDVRSIVLTVYIQAGRSGQLRPWGGLRRAG